MAPDLEADYARAGFGGTLPFGRRPALLVIDVARAYVDPASPLYAGVEAALASNQRLIAAAREAGVPCVFTRVIYQPGGIDGGLFYRKVPALSCFDAGNPLGDYAEGVEPRADEVVISKQYASAFHATPLAATLNAAGIDSLLIGGFSTSGCVRASALDALQHGFVPYVVREACGDRAPGPHEATLFDLQAKYAEVVTEEMAVGLMRGR